ncbi:restriction endonuclease subunit S [Enterococcus cecorum]|uniref:restriction endonuclease subunit S n=1 Tax=Enterococcus cecorum TaxID=44008 RepID=UPI002ACA12C3|nr:restriction endonuclease subunit S [Enterococcus cecorum]MDZ5612372.1 restriction endonuclease subunit S [Enterococcus cecorum]
MNEKKKLQPKVRFREFTGENAPDWEQRKFIDIVERLNKTEDNVKLPRIEFEDIVSGEGRLNKDLNTKKDDRKGIFFDENNILYGKLRPYLRKWYYARFAGVAIGDFWVLKIINNNHPLFIYYLIQTEKYQRVANDTSGTKMPRSDWKKVSESLFYIPNINEQKKISTIFNIIDNLITLHQRKLEQLEQLKNTLLSKMFPKSGTNIPEIRFSGFTDAWKQRKLGEVVNITMGQSPNSENYTENPDDNILVQGNADLKNGRVFPRVWTTQITKTAEKGDLILSVRAPVGSVGKTDYDVVLGRGVAGIKGNEFIFQMLGKMNIDGYWNKYSTGSTFESINSNDIIDAQIVLPKEDEQIKLGIFLHQLDEIITIHQRKLEQLKNLKQTLLNKMFI